MYDREIVLIRSDVEVGYVEGEKWSRIHSKLPLQDISITFDL